jgi:hypothetical protein
VTVGMPAYLGICIRWVIFTPRRPTRNPRFRKFGEQDPVRDVLYMLIQRRLIKRATIVGRLFYHTAMCLLPQVNPLMSKDSEEMRHMQLNHAHQICGITAHVKDRAVASMAIRSLAIAAECLVVRREQEEVLAIFENIRKETGWRIGFLHGELKATWGWPQEVSPPQVAPQQDPVQLLQATSLPSAPAPPQRGPTPSGIRNPLLKTADFSLPNHPYQQYYQPPNPQHQPNHFVPSYL